MMRVGKQKVTDLVLSQGKWLALVIVLLALAGAVWLAPGRGSLATPSASAVRAGASSLPPLPTIGLPDAVAPEEELLKVEPKTALEINAARPFSTAPNTSARPFRSALSGADRDRAISCLAIAAIYEAGGNADDQWPVMQTVLNRVRHPAFPSSICGAVFQGAERQTGCQFSFTCDGSMGRWRPSPAAYAAAKLRAEAMLEGHVDKRVGLATHYHTDWVVPYWSASLTKITAVKTHLFFRWDGFWGTRAAFSQKSSGREITVPQLAIWADAHKSVADIKGEEIELALPDLPGKAGEPGSTAVALAAASAPPPRVPVMHLTLNGQMPGRWALDALALCGNRPECRAVGWIDPARAPAVLDQASLSATPPDFVYVQELRNRLRQPWWDCGRWEQAATSRCLETPGRALSLVFG